MSSLRAKLGVPLVSAIIVTVLALQAFAGFVDTGRWGWPFIAYPMYKQAHYDGERVYYDYSTYFVLDDNTRIPITPQDVNTTFWLFRYGLVFSALKGDIDRMKSIVDKYCDDHNVSVKQIILEDLGIQLTRSGMVTGLNPEVVASIDFTCGLTGGR